MSAIKDPQDDTEYAAFVETLAKECQCSEKPCEGLLAGGLCDSDGKSESTYFDTDEDRDY